jgi:pimeloyl-ACP methyl ester carboxylesterase
MVAYAYAAQFPSATEKLVLMDAYLPGVPGWEPIYKQPELLAFSLSRPDSRSPGKGQGRHFLCLLLEPSRGGQASLAARSRPQSLCRGLFPSGAHASGVGVLRLVHSGVAGLRANVPDQAGMPVLSIGGDKSLGVSLGEQVKFVAVDVTVVVVQDSGNWIIEEQPKQTMDALVKFL